MTTPESQRSGAPRPAQASHPHPLRITDTTLRDGHQSLAATRMRTKDMEPIAPKMDAVGFHSAEVWGGATFDVATRFLFEDPWDRLRTLKRLMPNTPLQMLLRGQNLVGYRNYADDVVDAFVAHTASCGMDIFRIFDALNDERNLLRAHQAVKRAGKHSQLCLCYSVTEEGRMGGRVYNLEYFLEKARILEKMGCDSICIKDMAGLLAPPDAYTLISALKKQVKVPIQLHTHYTSGMASMTVLKAVEAGVDVVDTCLAPFALRTAQPAVEPLVVSLRGTPRDTGLDLNQLIALGEHLETLASYLRPHMVDGRLAVVDPRVLTHQVPGGMVSNLISQLREVDALDRLPEVLEDLPRTRRELGYPPLVTPTSQIVGVQAVNNVLFGRWKVVSSQVKDYCYGLYGKPPAPIDLNVQELALKAYDKGSTPITGRAADTLSPEMEKAKEATKDLAKDIGDVLTYALYPTTGLQFLRVKYNLAPKPPEPPAHPKPAPAQAGQAPSPRARRFNVHVDGNMFQVTVDPADEAGATAGGPRRPAYRSPTPSGGGSPSPSVARAEQRPGAGGAPLVEGESPISAPMPGIVVRFVAEPGAQIKAGDTVVILEAMKMENALPSPINGVVKEHRCQPGAKVTRGEVLAIIAPQS
ncbi:MAG: pyruvate carboxylase subunit B [Dehalococcoidia bacterium]|nr:pyruvate carboxylase subunit B [Dehalococcoidia bacterium]